MGVVEESAADADLCFADESKYSVVISSPTQLSLDVYGTDGFTWSEEQEYKTPTLACGDRLALYRTNRWVQTSDTLVFITTAQGVECSEGDGRREYAETVRLGELAAKSVME